MKQLKQPHEHREVQPHSETTYTPNNAGALAFFFFLFSTWMIIRFVLVEFLGDGNMTRFLGLVLGIAVINPVYNSFTNLIMYLYDED